MRFTSLKIISLGAAALMATSAWAQRPYYLVSGVHPGYSLVNMKPSSAPTGQPNVGAMTWLPGGRLFIASMSTQTATGALDMSYTGGFILSGIPGATSWRGTKLPATVAFTVSIGSFFRYAGRNASAS